MRILVIDDEPVFLEIMEHMLAKYGERDVMCATSGAEALDFIRRSAIPFDLFLVDIQMPKMSGIELVTAIRKIRDCQSTPIMMVTKVTERGSVDSAFTAGATDYLTKPLDKLEFRARIGVMQRMNAERQQNQALKQAFHQNGGEERKIGFEQPLDLPSADFLIELPVLRNYLSALGRIERISMSVLSFNIENLPTIYANADNELYIDVVEDIATTLFTSLRPQVMMMCYVGSGTFVCVLRGGTSIDMDEVMLSVENNKFPSRDFYIHYALPQPIFRSGQLVRFGILGRKSADQAIDKAIKSASQQSPASVYYNRKIA